MPRHWQRADYLLNDEGAAVMETSGPFAIYE